MEPIFWIAIMSNVATLGLAAAVFIPLSRAAARRLSVPRADAQGVGALETELESHQARLTQTEERVAFLEQFLERAPDAPALQSPRPANDRAAYEDARPQD